jgi:hypothetical protein
LNGRYPDIAHEVQAFLNGFDRLIRLPLISDDELEGLFSSDLLGILAQLNQHDQAENICASCSDRCCGLIKCELYDPDFGTCPAFNLRPLLCRMHYCHKFDLYREEVKVIGDIFLECLLAAQRKGSRKTVLFDSPPLGPAAPALAAIILRLTAAFREGSLTKTAVLPAIQAEVKEFRIFQRD